MGDDIEVYGVDEKVYEWSCENHGKHKKEIQTENLDKKIAILHMLRSQRQMEEATSLIHPYLILAAPKETGKTDYIGAFCVTTGIGLDKLCEKFEKDQDDYNSIMASPSPIVWQKHLLNTCTRKYVKSTGVMLPAKSYLTKIWLKRNIEESVQHLDMRPAQIIWKRELSSGYWM